MILVLAGTKDAREIIGILQDYNKTILASVVTEYGYELLKDVGIELIRERLSPGDMEEIICQEGLGKCH